MAEPKKGGLGPKGRLALERELEPVELFELPLAVAAAKRISDEMRKLEKAEKQQHHDATHDTLTGLPNRKLFFETLQEQVAKNKGSFALIYFDLDKFREVNNAQGHEAGDKSLVKAAKTAQMSIRHEQTGRRPADFSARFVARLGGDEFVALLPGISVQRDVDDVMARIQTNLAAEDISVSLGGRVHRPHETAAEFLDAVDQLMYQEKNAHHARTGS